MTKTVTTPLLGFSGQGRRSRNDERTLSQRFDGRTMASDSEAAAQAEETWPAADLPAVDLECDSVCQSNRLPVASTAP